MRKLSLLMALLLCVTVGGVYATWTYYDTTADVFDASAEIKVELADVSSSGASGSYSMSTNLALVIDQKNEDHEAELKFISNNGEAIHLTLVFKPSDNASSTIKQNGIPTELFWTTTTEMLYEGTPIFTFTNPSNGTFEENVTWTQDTDENGDEILVATYDEATLKSMITLNHVKLDEKAKYDAFKACLTGNIVANITDGNFAGNDQG